MLTTAQLKYQVLNAKVVLIGCMWLNENQLAASCLPSGLYRAH